MTLSNTCSIDTRLNTSYTSTSHFVNANHNYARLTQLPLGRWSHNSSVRVDFGLIRAKGGRCIESATIRSIEDFTLLPPKLVLTVARLFPTVLHWKAFYNVTRNKPPDGTRRSLRENNSHTCESIYR